MKNKFTLIELLIVIAIIGILLTLLLPSLGKAREHARLVVCMSNQSQITKMIALYSRQNDGWVPPYHTDETEKIDNMFDTRYFYMAGGWRAKRNLAYLFDFEEEVSNGQLFYCPAQKNAQFQYETYTRSDGFWPVKASTNGGTIRVRVGYNYNPVRQANEADRGNKLPMFSRMDKFDDRTVMLTDMVTQVQSWYDRGRDTVAHSSLFSFAVTRGDGSVRIKRSKELVTYLWTTRGGGDTAMRLNSVCEQLLE